MEDRILITGASGFLGKHLIKKLEKTKHKIYCLSTNLLEGKNVESVINKIKPSIVIHLAANVDLSRDRVTAKKNIDVNLTGTLNLVNALKKNQIRKFIFASTEEIYGDGLLPFKEDQLPKPPSSYSVTKLAGEHLCKIYASNLNFSLIIFRLATFYGPNNSVNRFFSRIILSALKNQDISLSSKNKKRDYLYIDDAINAFILAINKNLNGQYVFNIGSGKNYSLDKVIKIILKTTNSKSKLLWNKIPERSLEANEWLMNISLVKKLLDWYPIISLEEGLIKTIKSFNNYDK